MRQADAKRCVAEGGAPGLTFEEAVDHVVDYYVLVGELFAKHDLDPEEHYEFDVARGLIFKSFD